MIIEKNYFCKKCGISHSNYVEELLIERKIVGICKYDEKEIIEENILSKSVICKKCGTKYENVSFDDFFTTKYNY